MTPSNKLTNQHTIASYFARAHLQNALNLGGNEAEILALAELTDAQLKQAKSRVSAKQLASIVVSCWQLSGDELLGFTQQKLKVGVFALLAGHLINCKNLEEVINYINAFYTLTGDQLAFNIEKNATQVRFTVNANFKSNKPHDAHNSLLNELLLLIFHRFTSWLLGQLIPLYKVYMQHPKPAHHEEYRLMFSCPCSYQNADNTLVFDAKYLNFPVVQNSNTLASYLNEVPLQWFKKQNYYDTFSAQVMRMLEETVLTKASTLEHIAEKLNTTTRTLRRKLNTEGSRFQQLKDNVRRDRAINLFEQTNLTIADISLRVGFTEPATFTRAFKHWTGVSPSTYRAYNVSIPLHAEKNRQI